MLVCIGLPLHFSCHCIFYIFVARQSSLHLWRFNSFIIYKKPTYTYEQLCHNIDIFFLFSDFRHRPSHWTAVGRTGDFDLQWPLWAASAPVSSVLFHLVFLLYACGLWHWIHTGGQVMGIVFLHRVWRGGRDSKGESFESISNYENHLKVVQKRLLSLM